MDGALNYAISLNNRGFTGPLSVAQAAVRGFGTAAKSALGPLLGLVSAGAAVGTALKSVNKAAEFEGLQIAMKNILGTKEAANDLLAQVQAFGARTPFEFATELAPLSRILINAKVSTGDLIGEMTALGNVAAGTKTPIGEIGEIYAKTLNLGKLGNEEILRLAERGVPIYSMLAKTLGVTEGEISKLAERGAIGAGVLRKAFQDLAGSTGSWGNMMAEMSRTTLGLWSNLKDVVDAVLLKFGQPVNDALKPVLTEAIGMLDAMTPKAAALGRVLASSIEIGLAAVKSGQIGALISAQFRVAAMTSGNYLAKALHSAVGATGGSALLDALSGGMEAGAKVFEGAMLNAVVSVVNFFGTSLANRLAAVVEATPLLGGSERAAAIRGVAAGSSALDAGAGDAALDQGKTRLGQVVEEVARRAAEWAKNGGIFSNEEVAAAQAELAAVKAQILKASQRTAVAEEKTADKAELTQKTQEDITRSVAEAQRSRVAAGARGGGGGAAGGPLVGGDPGAGRRRGVLNAAESSFARMGRMSAADREGSALDSGFFRGANAVARRNQGRVLSPLALEAGGAFTGLGGARPLGRGAALAAGVGATINPNARALGAGRQQAAAARAGNDQSIAGILTKIANNTEALKSLAAA